MKEKILIMRKQNLLIRLQINNNKFKWSKFKIKIWMDRDSG